MNIEYDKNKLGVYIVNTITAPLMLRTKPDSSGTVLTQMSKNSEVVCYGCYSGSWLEVIYCNGETVYEGFAHTDYLTRKS